MTIEEIDSLPWAKRNIPHGWDFRNKSDADMEALNFGAYSFCYDPGRCKLVYGGRINAEKAVHELSLLGINATLRTPSDSFLDDDGETVRIRGWAWNVYFRLDNSVIPSRHASTP